MNASYAHIHTVANAILGASPKRSKKRSATAASPVGPRRIPQQARSRERVDRILRAARRLLGENTTASMREIADGANVPIASLYQYFPDKAAVMRALLSEFYERMRVRLETALRFVQRVEDVPRFTDAMIDALVSELGSAQSHLNVWTAAQESPVLRALDMRDALALADMLSARFLELAPAIDPERVRDTCVFAVVMAGPAIRQASLLPRTDGERVLRELKALIRLRVESLSSEQAARSPAR
jgi:AcrR family transcriptional regulator